MVRLTTPKKKLRRPRPKHRRIRAINVWPALLTLGNLLCGFAAIHFCSRSHEIQNPVLKEIFGSNLALACYFIFAAMVCDALDGRLARFSRTTSDFGGQLDSLADVVSFGAAPAFIAIRLIMKVSEVSPAAETAFGRFCWIASGAYLACAALRLARFNVENVPDESAHMSFKGLPVPGAAGALISVVLLSEVMLPEISPSLAKYGVLTLAVPWVAIILGLLMVSRLPYMHILNRYLRGKKPFWVLVALAFALLAFLLWPHWVLAIILCGYALSGPVAWLINRIRGRFARNIPQEQL